MDDVVAHVKREHPSNENQLFTDKQIFRSLEIVEEL
jgi:hypothetical protein